ncbi:MAG: hypothetical protein P1U32_08000 [Legionellaceae bacterium]|nr:hypothetical protein [Legionellaceae bacterium]
MATYLEQLRTGNFSEDDLVSKTEFTILRNARRNPEDTAELAAAIGANDKVIGNMVSLPAQRLILFETIAAIETSIRLNEGDLNPLSVDLYRHHIKQGAKALQAEIGAHVQVKTQTTLNELSVFQQENPETRESSTLSKPAQKAVETFQKIKTRLLEKAYVPLLLVDRHTNTVIFDGDSDTITEENVDDIALFITQQIVEDSIYNEHAKQIAAHYVDQQLDNVLDNNLATYLDSEQPLQRLSVQKGDDRHAFILLGAPACGKGTMCAALEIQAKEGLGIDWNDTIGKSTLLLSELWEKNADKIKEKADKYRENIHESEDKKRFENTKGPK